MPRIDEKLSLKISDAGWASVVDRDGMRVFQMPGCSAQATKTAQRMAACWNACSGIETEVLEAMPIIPATPDALAAPDLLAALIAVVGIADRKTDEFDTARAAIAKAKGGPANA